MAMRHDQSFSKNNQRAIDEWNLVKALYGLTSDQGAHQMVAPREYARIAKNMTYEIALLALTKFAKVEKKS